MAPSASAEPVSPDPVEPQDFKEKYRLNEKVINEEFKIWKKTSPMLYDAIYSYALEWPSLSVDWFSEVKQIESKPQSVQGSFAIGTHTPKGTDNKLSIYSIDLPAPLNSKESEELPKFSPPSQLEGSQFKLLKQWNHPGEINKLRINQANNLIATQTNNGTVLIFDPSLASKPKYELKYHTLDGFGLEWNPVFEKNQLLTSSQDTNIALWDLSNGNTSKPLQTFTSSTSIVNDISWNKQLNNLFASVTDDRQILINDTRTSKDVIKVENAHELNVTCVEFNHHLPNLFVTGGGDNFINCWDLRNLSEPIRKLYGHNDCLLDLKFNPTNPFLLSSSSFDRRSLIWNLEKLSDGPFDLQQFEKKKSEYFDPCLSFIHGGHTGPISESAWHPVIEDLLVTCARDNLVEVWKPRLYYEDLDEESEEEEEEDEQQQQQQDEEAPEEAKKDEDVPME